MFRQPADSIATGWIRRAVNGLRTACVIGGLALALLFGVEFAYRGYEQMFPPGAGNGQDLVAPNTREPWFKGWAPARQQHVFGRNVVSDPYRGWWVQSGRHDGLLVVEPSGYRHTVQVLAGDPAARRRVYMFGGSTMWGYTARDPSTIPSFVAAQLAAAGVHDIEIENKSQSAYNFTQGLATLELELRRGARPAAVVFLDGVNEVGVVLTGEQPGDIYGQRKWRERFQPMRANEMLQWLVSRLHVVAALRSALSANPELPPVEVAAACRTIADQYANLVRIGEALGREFGFKIYFFWQPTIAMSRKALGPWETKISAEGGESGRMVEMMRACATAVEARLAQRVGATFIPLHSIFDRKQGDVFVDHYGHVIEPANADIAAAITERLLPVLK